MTQKLTASATAICLSLVLIFTLLMPACQRKEETVKPTQKESSSSSRLSTPTNDSTGFHLQDLKQIPAEDPLVARLKLTRDIRQLDATLGTPQWDQINLATYAGTTTQAILVPLSKGKTLIAYTTPGQAFFETIVIEIKGSAKQLQETAPQDKFSGEINFYLTNGGLLTGAIYQEDIVMNTKPTDEQKLQEYEAQLQADELLANNNVQKEQMNTSSYWRYRWCVRNCLANLFPRLPWWIKITCQAALGACFGAKPVGCGAAIGCLGGYALGCRLRCAIYGRY